MDSSVLIVLSKSGLLPILRLAGEVVIVPRAVAGEINARGPEDVTARTVSAASWLVVADTPPIPRAIERCRLDDGEAAVLAWAMSHPGAEAIVDDRTARRCGLELGIPIRGTVNLVLAAKQARVIPLAGNVPRSV